MLVITRKTGEVVHVGDDVTITVVECQGNRVRLGIAAPRDKVVLRGELVARDARNKDARDKEGSDDGGTQAGGG